MKLGMCLYNHKISVPVENQLSEFYGWRIMPSFLAQIHQIQLVGAIQATIFVRSFRYFVGVSIIIKSWSLSKTSFMTFTVGELCLLF